MSTAESLRHPKPPASRAILDRRLAWWLAAPALLVMGVTVLYPLVYTLVLSFMKNDLTRPDQNGFVGLANYVKILGSDAEFWSSLGITAYFVAAAVLLEVGGGLLWALLLNRPFRGADSSVGSHCCPGRCRPWSTRSCGSGSTTRNTAH